MQLLFRAAAQKRLIILPDAVHSFEEGRSAAGERQAGLSIAVKNTEAQLLLQPGDLHTDRGLTDVQLGCGQRNAVQLGCAKRIGKLYFCHCHTSLSEDSIA